MKQQGVSRTIAKETKDDRESIEVLVFVIFFYDRRQIERVKSMAMAKRITMRAVMACGLLSGTAAVCAGQAYTPPPPPLTTLPPCPVDKHGKPLKKAKNCDPTIYPPETKESRDKRAAEAAAPAATPDPNSAAQKFPFPGEQPAQPAASSTAQKFPYPGEAPAQPSADSPDASAGKKFPYPGKGSPGSDVPHDPAAEKKAADTPAGKRFPYPGESPDLQPDPGATPKPDTPPSNSPPSGSSSSSSDEADGSSSSKTPDPLGPKGQYDDDDDTGNPKLADKGSSGRRTLKVVKPQSDTDRVDEDLSIAKYYVQSGNKMGAYLRAKDAVKIQPDYPEAHFALGEAAKRLNKKEEAVAEFTAYLKLSPDGEKSKAAEKALEDLK